MNEVYATYQDQMLLASISNGDELAFGELFRRYQHRIYSFTLKITKTEVFAQEVTQEVFVKLWEHREKLDHVLDARSYLFKMSANHTYNFLRSELKEESRCAKLAEIMTGRTADAADDLAILKSSEKLLHEAVGLLPEQQRKVFTLSFIDGLGYNEIADQLKISPNTVRNHLVAANRAVRKYVAGHQGYAPALLLYLLLQG